MKASVWDEKENELRKKKKYGNGVPVVALIHVDDREGVGHNLHLDHTNAQKWKLSQ